jgi:hypothetical protein
MPFAKGRSGNPGGRPKALKDVEEAARAHAPAALATLVPIASDTTAPPAAQVSAATVLLDRAYGRPRQAIEANGKMAVTLEHLVVASYLPPRLDAPE